MAVTRIAKPAHHRVCPNIELSRNHSAARNCNDEPRSENADPGDLMPNLRESFLKFLGFTKFRCYRRRLLPHAIC